VQDFGGSGPEGRRLGFDVQKERLVQGLLHVLLATHDVNPSTDSDPELEDESHKANPEASHDDDLQPDLVVRTHVFVNGGLFVSLWVS
jgi:hypothetical protein